MHTDLQAGADLHFTVSQSWALPTAHLFFLGDMGGSMANISLRNGGQAPSDPVAFIWRE